MHNFCVWTRASQGLSGDFLTGLGSGLGATHPCSAVVRSRDSGRSGSSRRRGTPASWGTRSAGRCWTGGCRCWLRTAPRRSWSGPLCCSLGPGYGQNGRPLSASPLRGWTCAAGVPGPGEEPTPANPGLRAHCGPPA